MLLFWFLVARLIYIMYIVYLLEKANVQVAGVSDDNIFWYRFVIFIDFFAIKSLFNSILLSY